MECERLWREYTDATKAYLKVVSDQQDAAIRHDSTMLAQLDHLHIKAGERRAAARNALKDHEAQKHRSTANG